MTRRTEFGFNHAPKEFLNSKGVETINTIGRAMGVLGTASYCIGRAMAMVSRTDGIVFQRNGVIDSEHLQIAVFYTAMASHCLDIDATDPRAGRPGGFTPMWSPEDHQRYVENIDHVGRLAVQGYKRLIMQIMQIIDEKRQPPKPVIRMVR